MRLRCKLIILYLILLGIAWTMKGCEAEEVNMNFIAQIESNCNPYAFNKTTGATGLLQITKPVVDEFNKRYSSKELYYDIKELFQIDVNWKIGSWYMNTRIPQMLKAYKIPDTIDFRLACYNWGIGNVIKWYRDDIPLPLETQRYIKRYHKLEKERR